MGIYKTYQADFRTNLRLATPIMIAQLGQVLVNFIDNIMVGRLGPEPLAAVSLAIALYISFLVVGMGISFALPPLISQAYGEGANRQISQYFKHSMIINIVFAFISALIIEAGIPLIKYLGQDPEVVALAIPYLRISAWALIPMMIFQAFRTYADGMAQTKPAMIAILIGNVFNILLNYMLIFGKFGAPALGVTGAAIGTFIARIIMIVVMIYVLYNRQDLWLHVVNANFKKYQKNLFKKTLNLGIPTSLQMFFEVSAFAGAALIMGTLGAKPLAAHQIAINLSSMTFLTCTGLAMAATVRVGNTLGKQDFVALNRAGKSAIIQVALFMLFAAIVFVSLRNQLPYIYIDEPEVVEIASVLLVMAAIFQIPDGVQVAALGTLRGLQDVKLPSVITFVAYWVLGLPFSYFAAKYWDLGPPGVWLGLVIGLTTSATFLTWRFHSKATKLIRENSEET